MASCRIALIYIYIYIERESRIYIVVAISPLPRIKSSLVQVEYSTHAVTETCMNGKNGSQLSQGVNWWRGSLCDTVKGG